MQNNGTKIIGVWDDHDYGINDGGDNFVFKHQNRDIFLDFIGEPKDSVRRLDKNSAIHQDYIINHNGMKIHILLLDNRFDFNRKSNDRLGER